MELCPNCKNMQRWINERGEINEHPKQVCICEHFREDHNLKQFNCHARIKDINGYIYICECRLFEINRFQSEA